MRAALSCLAPGLAMVLALQATARAQEAGPVRAALGAAPAPVYARGKRLLIYELQVGNTASDGKARTLRRVEVIERRAGLVASYAGAELAAAVVPANGKDGDPLQLTEGRKAIVFLWLTLEPSVPSKPRLSHRLSFATAGESAETMVECCRVNVAGEPPVVIGPPVRGGGWLAWNGLSNATDHRRAAFGADGPDPRISQRFAIDWMLFGPNGEIGPDWRRDEHPNSWPATWKHNGDFFGYGAEVLAVADGVVHSIQDHVPENEPGKRPNISDNGAVGGNIVWLDLKRNRYAFYAHLQPGSLRVQPGDRVRRGQVLGRIGNSGNSNAPHLHFHMSDSPSTLLAEGVPYVFEKFWVEGSATKLRLHPSAAVLREREVPLEGDVVRFP